MHKTLGKKKKKDNAVYDGSGGQVGILWMLEYGELRSRRLYRKCLDSCDFKDES
jgi:hypothetical protein